MPGKSPPSRRYTFSSTRRASRRISAHAPRTRAISDEYSPCFIRAFRMRASPSAVFGPVLAPPCIRHLPFGIAGDWHGLPPRVRVPQRGDDWAKGSVVAQGGRRCMGFFPMPSLRLSCREGIISATGNGIARDIRGYRGMASRFPRAQAAGRTLNWTVATLAIVTGGGCHAERFGGAGSGEPLRHTSRLSAGQRRCSAILNRRRPAHSGGLTNPQKQDFLIVAPTLRKHGKHNPSGQGQGRFASNLGKLRCRNCIGRTQIPSAGFSLWPPAADQ